MEEYLCINILILILLVTSTVIVTILSVCLIIIEDGVLTREFKDSINTIISVREEAWTPEPVTC